MTWQRVKYELCFGQKEETPRALPHESGHRKEHERTIANAGHKPAENDGGGGTRKVTEVWPQKNSESGNRMADGYIGCFVRPGWWNYYALDRHDGYRWATRVKSGGHKLTHPARTRQRQAGHQQPGTINQNWGRIENNYFMASMIGPGWRAT